MERVPLPRWGSRLDSTNRVIDKLAIGFTISLMAATVTLSDDGLQRRVNGRIEAIIRILLEYQDEISRPNKLSLRFDCAGQTVISEVERRLDFHPSGRPSN
jgi:hypothetical protein